MTYQEDGKRADTVCNQASDDGKSTTTTHIWHIGELQKLGSRYASDSEEHRTIKEAVQAYLGLRRREGEFEERFAHAEREVERLSHRIDLARFALGES